MRGARAVRRLAGLTAVALGLLPAQGSAQVQAQGTALFESYSFDPGLGFQDVMQFSLPLSVTYAVNPQTTFTLSTGLTRVALTPSGTAEDIVVSGLTDSEARLIYEVLRDRLSLMVTGRIPTGVDGLDAEQGAVLGVLATDILGFSTRSLGSGGSLGIGFSGAYPVGRFALGLAGTVTQSGSFTPVAAVPQELKPGTELRLRGGVEGPVAETAYVRAALILARRGDDEINGEALGVGTRWSGYVSVEQRAGTALVTGYIFDQLRATPQIDNTALGSGVLPKGNLFAIGATVAVPLDRDMTLTPRAEYRRADQAPSLDASDMEKLGSSVRLGSDFRYRVNPMLDVVVEASALFGTVVSGTDVGTNGFRIGAGVQLTR